MNDNQTLPEMRAAGLFLLRELQKHDIRPYKKERTRIDKIIRFSYNEQKVLDTVYMLENMLSNAVMRKMSEGI